MKDLQEKNIAELRVLIAETRAACRDLQFKIAAKQLKNIREIRTAKKNLARLQTVLRSKSQNEN